MTYICTRSTISTGNKNTKYKKFVQEVQYVQGEWKMKTYVVANQKGGIGKSTTATCLASELQHKGYKVLLVDADQQGNSTDTYRAKIQGEATLYDALLDENRIPLEEAVQHTECGDIVASDPLLREADKRLTTDVEGLYRMADAIEELAKKRLYDFCIIDTAPALNALTHSMLVAADKVIVPLDASRYSLQGLAQLNESIMAIQRRQNPRLEIAGLLLVRYNPRTLLSKEVREALQTIATEMDTRVFETTIRESNKVREAQAMRVPLREHARNSTAQLDYEAFTEELLKGERINGTK